MYTYTFIAFTKLSFCNLLFDGYLCRNLGPKPSKLDWFDLFLRFPVYMHM